jgi:hypothetical protein
MPDTLRQPNGDRVGANYDDLCHTCGQPLTENERDIESGWFFQQHAACLLGRRSA